MKTRILNKILFLSLFFLLTMSKCTEDEIVDARDKFTGNWTCYESSKVFGPSTFSVVISKSETNPAQILMQNFYHAGNDEQAYGSVSGNSVNIPKQPICNGDYQLWGSGYMESDTKITWLYYSDDGQEIDTVNATFTR